MLCRNLLSVCFPRFVGETPFKGYSLVEFHTKEIMNLMKSISNEFLAASFKLRVMEAAAYTALRRNDVLKAREIAFELIEETDEDMFPIAISSINNLLAESYVFDDSILALRYNKKALKIFNQYLPENVHRKRILESTSDFIKIHSGNIQGLFLSDPAERIHWLSKSTQKVENELALSLLDEIEKENGELSPFQKYYKGLAANDPRVLEEAVDAFVLKGDLFYSQLPKLAVIRQNPY
ncbi:AimR family lysis-lysogeny pheromone receptor [Bacillus infantis]|uniref:AimR family lysis-lysogeny pheromone receptor n=1 Tax=Bacillus infantis TaxID=324767 RepID=UPI002FBD3BA6